MRNPVTSPAPALLRPGTLLRYGVSLGVLGWIVAQVEWREFGGLRGLDWPLAAAAVVLAGLAYPLQAWRWQRLLAALHITLPARVVHGVFWVGNLYNSFLPGGVAGDGVRVCRLWPAVPGRRAGLVASIVADRLLGFGALLALAVLALGAHLLARGGGRELHLLLAASAGALVLLAGLGLALVRAGWWEQPAAKLLGAERSAALRAAATALGAARGTLLLATAASVAVWLLDFLSLWLLARAAGVDAGPLEMSVAAAAAYVAAMLPLSIGGHGIREGALVLVLSWLGTGSADGALGLAIAFWAVTTFWSLAGILGHLVPVPAAKS